MTDLTTDITTEIVVPRPPIDPRFARRWIEVHRQEGRRRLRYLVAGLVPVVLAAVAAGVVYSPLLRVRHVRVAVHGPVSAATVERVAGLDHYHLMVDISPAAITRRLDAVPSLGGARVTRSWPGTVTVAVSVRSAVAQVQAGAGWALLDPTGRVLSIRSAQALGLPVITGAPAPPAVGQWIAGSLGPAVIPGTAPAGEAAMDAAADSVSVPRGMVAALVAMQALPAAVRPDIISVSASGPLSMAVLPATLAAGSIPVNLGDGSQLALKLDSLATLLTSANLSGVVSVDLTVPGRPAALTAR